MASSRIETPYGAIRDGAIEKSTRWEEMLRASEKMTLRLAEDAAEAVLKCAGCEWYAGIGTEYCRCVDMGMCPRRAELEGKARELAVDVRILYE